MATEWLDPMDYISELENEKENLLLEVEELTRKNKSLIEYIEKQDLKNAQDVVDERDDCLKEIETLRLAMNETGALLDKCQEEKGEWKRRATVVWESHRELGREVADWFEEKDDVND